MAKSHTSNDSIVARRLREARLRAGIAQDRLGVMIGLDEGSSSARMSRYETGVHEPPLHVVQLLAKVLRVPTAYFYAEEDSLAEWILTFSQLKAADRRTLIDTAASMQAIPPQ